MAENIHDRVISEIVGHLNQQSFDIYTNPGEQKNAGINDNFPDIILTEKGTTTVKFIMEVETLDSVTKEESISQWKKYFTEIDATLYLVVPSELLNRSIELCKKVDVNARFATYTISNNVISFEFK